MQYSALAVTFRILRMDHIDEKKVYGRGDGREDAKGRDNGINQLNESSSKNREY